MLSIKQPRDKATGAKAAGPSRGTPNGRNAISSPLSWSKDQISSTDSSKPYSGRVPGGRKLISVQEIVVDVQQSLAYDRDRLFSSHQNQVGQHSNHLGHQTSVRQRQDEADGFMAIDPLTQKPINATKAMKRARYSHINGDSS